MATDCNPNFDEQLMNINAKLKKRFMRKPNITEASNEFIALAIQCENAEQPAFAGHAYVGSAKCEALIGNTLGEAEYHVTAARQFMKAEKQLFALKFDSPDREHLEAAIGCYMQAFEKYPSKSPLRTSILMELSNDLHLLNLKNEALHYYEQALELVEERTLKLMCLRRLLDLQIECEKYEIALETANTVCTSDLDIPDDLLIETQISRIFLTMIVKPCEEDRSESLKQMFKDLMTDDESDVIPFNIDLRLKLQSIVIARATEDVPALIKAVANIKCFLTPMQEELIQTLIKIEMSAYS